MNSHPFYILRIPFIFSVLLTGTALFYSCSQESSSFTAKTYHNLLARDNPFFLARERMKEVELKVYEMKQDDYNVVLHPIPPFDTLKTKTLVAQLDDIIKKASIPIRRHKNSQYVDDSYILVGRCRMYKGEFKLGVETFKYVNAQSQDPDDKHESLIYLMRAYIAWNQYENAKAVADFLDKEPLNELNKAEYYVTKAEYFRHFELYQEMIPLLTEAAPLLQKRDRRSRMHYILGQLHQQFGQDTSAYKEYRKVVHSNPPYDLLFYARLNMYQVTSIDKDNSAKKIKQYYEKLLRDPKNAEYKDKIYYEMAMFEYKQGNHKGAINYLKESVKVGRSNAQKSLSFLKLAEIHYDELEDYENAQAYYDSTAQTFDKTDKRYPTIVKREKVLDEFVLHLKTIRREDSLLRVAAMDSVTLNTLIDTLIAREQAEYMKQQLALKKQQKQGSGPAINATAFSNMDPNGASWYFSNTKLIQEGLVEFEQKWGKRKLEDHWRRSKKEVIPSFDTAVKNPDSLATADATAPSDEIVPLKIDRNKYLKNIPFTAAEKDTANSRIEKSLFKVGSIYNHQLDEEDRAIKAYETLLNRYPKTEYEPEVIYNMYLIYKARNDARYELAKKILFDKYPNSIYSKLIRNPDYFRDNKITNKLAEEEYKEAYELYKMARYNESDSLSALLMTKYPESEIKDKLTYLKILCKLKTQGPSESLITELKNFTTDFPDSPLSGNAKELIATIEKIKPAAVPENK